MTASAIGSGSKDSSTVFVVDDDDSVREALQELLSSVGLRSRTFASAHAFLEFDDTGTGAPSSCLIVDVRMPGIGGLDLQSLLAQRNRVPPIIFMSAFGDVAMTVQAMKAGARDFLTKPFRDQDMLDAVWSALTYDKWRRAIDKSRESLKERYFSLSDRERALLQMLGDGLANKQIASKLCLSEITVKVGRRAVMRKMRARNFAELIKMESLVRGLESEKMYPSHECGASDVVCRSEFGIAHLLGE
ncbi:response regulator transcription factor [Paraburkholderia rhizosphaerae]|uniref:FixJ family two-component response regulator n=1 Tax=Paraburkholderia rhizosphaerae TaxID=480658 RepID=A0A4R8LDC8_9BURK|nr:response regulator [Paraburkholderia rhizosphaerae]TDY40575.1 FixJ family two-component response regulator [Paraburkholderia rhizosphaerae]